MLFLNVRTAAVTNIFARVDYRWPLQIQLRNSSVVQNFVSSSYLSVISSRHTQCKRILRSTMRSIDRRLLAMDVSDVTSCSALTQVSSIAFRVSHALGRSGADLLYCIAADRLHCDLLRGFDSIAMLCVVIDRNDESSVGDISVSSLTFVSDVSTKKVPGIFRMLDCALPDA